MYFNILLNHIACKVVIEADTYSTLAEESVAFSCFLEAHENTADLSENV